MSNLLALEDLMDFYAKHEIKIQNKDLNNLLQDWLKSGSWVEIISSNKRFIQRGGEQKRILSVFFTLLTNHVSVEKDLTWENYCKILYGSKLYEKANINPWRKLFSNFFSFAAFNVKSPDVKLYLKKYNHIFLGVEFKLKHLQDVTESHLTQNIRTNFPLISKPHQIVTYECNGIGKTTYFTNIFINTDNVFLFTLLNTFINKLNTEFKNSAFTSTYYRILFVFFEESLSAFDINNLNDFNECTFKNQLRFFDQLYKKFSLVPSNKCDFPYNLLIRFYRFLDQFHYNENGNKLFNTVSFNTDIFLSIHHKNAIYEDYEIIRLNELEEVPFSNKWLLLGKDKVKYIGNKENSLLNFEVVKDIDLRKDLKEFVWRTKSSHRINRFIHLIHFLNEANEFFNNRRKLSYVNKDTTEKLFSNEFLFYFYTKLTLRSDLKATTINGIITILRSFLNYFQEKYNIPTLVINQWHEVDVEKFQEGKPISQKDFEVIRDTLRNKWYSDEDQLLFIVFQLSMTTKLRIGEILSLQRNCVTKADEKFGKITYYSKTSNGTLITDVFTIDKIRLIERAITLSHTIYEKAYGDLKTFIFIGLSRNIKGQVVSLHRRYNKEFTKIITELYNSTMIEEKYAPYSARDTHINNAYELVESGQISTLQVSTLTGNTAKIAQKHYLSKKRRARDYLEALHDVYIGEKESVGRVITDDASLKELPPVQNDAGSCSSKECVKSYGKEEYEESFYKCLTCRYFITSTERNSLFETRIKRFKDSLENASSNTERNYYKALIELYATYLAEMYALMEDQNG
ncbi:hypothetical protein [Bacillus sp. ISL-39]|uniref:hypothetical protein n=1 Tax=Bacillus sp. ISL-39 TaxID=2819124 RepID=UPI001BEBB5B1|nr:hypothetical protein [Bacillus sp. ISL-39]MBT2636589.1 hypothetical protein [Bacillus sp. ISL-39]